MPKSATVAAFSKRPVRRSWRRGEDRSSRRWRRFWSVSRSPAGYQGLSMRQCTTPEQLEQQRVSGSSESDHDETWLRRRPLLSPFCGSDTLSWSIYNHAVRRCSPATRSASGRSAVEAGPGRLDDQPRRRDQHGGWQDPLCRRRTRSACRPLLRVVAGEEGLGTRSREGVVRGGWLADGAARACWTDAVDGQAQRGAAFEAPQRSYEASSRRNPFVVGRSVRLDSVLRRVRGLC